MKIFAICVERGKTLSTLTPQHPEDLAYYFSADERDAAFRSAVIEWGLRKDEENEGYYGTDDYGYILHYYPIEIEVL